MSDSSGTDLVKYSRRAKGSTTERVDPDDWGREDGLLRLDLEDEILFVPFDRIHWIKRDKDDDD